MASIGDLPIIPVSSNAVAIRSRLYIDADGSPHAYAPKNSGLPTLDYLANAGSPGDWYGIATNSHGIPYIQGHSDPAPGYYVSTTALEDPNFAASDPNRYLNSERIPFVVIPSRPKFGTILGDVGFAFNLATGDSTQFVVGDIGPHNQFGEASVFFAKNLNVNPNAKTGGTDQHIIVYLFFQDSKINMPITSDSILAAAAEHYQHMGGRDALKAATSSWDWSKF